MLYIVQVQVQVQVQVSPVPVPVTYSIFDLYKGGDQKFW